MGTISWCLLICLLLDLLVNALPMYGSECLQPCKGERCEEMAKMMEHLIDFSVDPCEDFFARMPSPVLTQSLNLQEMFTDLFDSALHLLRTRLNWRNSLRAVLSLLSKDSQMEPIFTDMLKTRLS